MDILGIGAGVEASAYIYFTATRQTGKTTRLIEALKSGDRVVCRSDKEKRRMFYQLRNRGIDDVEVVSVPPDQPFRLVDRFPPSNGRTFFDDVWLQDFYLQEIKAAGRSLDRLVGASKGEYQSALHSDEAVMPIVNGGVSL